MNNEDMNGLISLSEKDCYFSFNGSLLKIFCNNGETNDLLFGKITDGLLAQRKKDIPVNRLDGKLFGSMSYITFYIDQKGYNYYPVSPDYEEMVLYIRVSKYVVKEWCKRSGPILTIASKQFHKFLGLIPRFSLVFDGQGKIGEIRESDVSSQ